MLHGIIFTDNYKDSTVIFESEFMIVLQHIDKSLKAGGNANPTNSLFSHGNAFPVFLTF